MSHNAKILPRSGSIKFFILRAIDLLPLAIRSKLKNRIFESRAYIHNLIGSISKGPVRVIIFAQGRTGSTLLESLLCSTGFFRPNGELLNIIQHGEVCFPIQYIKGLSKQKANENFIFHLKIDHLLDERMRPLEPGYFLETLYKDGWKVIYLKRNNKVRSALSNIVALSRKYYHKHDNRKEEIKLNVDCKAFVNRVQARFRKDKDEKKALANINYHEVIYERDLEKTKSHQNTINRILHYLSLKPAQAKTTYKKITTQSLQDMILNYDEFIELLKKHGWENYILEIPKPII